MADQNFKIEKATLLDAPLIASKLYEAFEREEKRAVPDEERLHILRYVIGSFADPNHVTLLAKVERSKHGKARTVVVGLAMFNIQMHPYGQVQAWSEHMYVDPDHRGNGVAHALVNTGLDAAKEAGAKVVFVEANYPDFFKPFGFKYDRTIMRKDLE